MGIVRRISSVLNPRAEGRRTPGNAITSYSSLATPFNHSQCTRSPLLSSMTHTPQCGSASCCFRFSSSANPLERAVLTALRQADDRVVAHEVQPTQITRTQHDRLELIFKLPERPTGHRKNSAGLYRKSPFNASSDYFPRYWRSSSRFYGRDFTGH